MKKIPFSFCLCCICFVATGQGTVNFFNSPTTLITGINSAPTTGAESYYFALLIAPKGTTDPRLFNFTGCYATNQAVPGRINGGWDVSVPGWPAGTERAFLVCGWPASTGHDWSPSRLETGGGALGMSIISSGIAGSGGPFPVPPLNLFSSTTISSGFMVHPACLGPYWRGFFRWPTNQTVVVGSAVVFDLAVAACPLPQYQWYLDGAPIPSATDGFYQIANAQLADSGTYSVTLFNPDWPPCCHNQGTEATLTVVTQPQPQSQTAFVDSTVHFEIGAHGPADLSFQWFFNSSNSIPAGSNSVLNLPAVQLAQAGAYNVVVTSAFGAITSSPATLSVVPTVESKFVPAVLLTGQTGTLVNLDCANAVGLAAEWTSLASVPLDRQSQFYFDLTTPHPQQRFYRAWQVDSTAALPTLHLDNVPALSLGAQVGSSVRVDYINQFGPTADWVTLDTVTLTNTSQLFIDASAIGQPPRLWRIVPVP